MVDRKASVLFGTVLLAATAAPAQERSAGRVASSAAGEVGQRQTRERAVANIQPMGRVNSRIQNRVQSRVRNRIDRNYDPQANAASPFEAASDQVRAATRPVRR